MKYSNVFLLGNEIKEYILTWPYKLDKTEFPANVAAIHG
jgi:hypothetical protein